MISFAKALAENEGIEKHVLLGNGFSQAWNYDLFNYKFLYEKADFKDRDGVIKSIFEKFDTYDFETVMSNMLAAASVLESYGASPEQVAYVRKDAEKLKETLIEVIALNHPEKPSSVTDEQYEMCRHFLSQFNTIFTLNYDLLMYWARNKNNLEPERYTTDDGFRYPLIWAGHGEGLGQQVFFLHGGLHIYDTSTSIKKLKWSDDAELTIVRQVRDNLEGNRFPLFVSEPSHMKKKDKILHNPYLDFCFQKLSKLENILYIYGHSFDESDKHIFDELNESGIKKVYVSIYGDENAPNNQRTKANALTYLSNLDVVFYKAESTPIWGEV